MMRILDFIKAISDNEYNDLMITLYGDSENVISEQKKRYVKALESFKDIFPDRDDVKMYSASGRTEIGGNHTDHQHGVVLAGAVNLDVIAVVSFHSDNVVRVKSEGYEPFEATLDNLAANPNDSGTASIIKGVIAKYSEKGVKVGGFDMYCTSDVISGGGISLTVIITKTKVTPLKSHKSAGMQKTCISAKNAVYLTKRFQLSEDLYL